MNKKDSIIAGLVVLGLIVSGLAFFHTSPTLGSYSPVTSGGFVTQTNPNGVNTFVAPSIFGNITNCGTSGYYINTSTVTLTATQFLSVCNYLVMGTSGTVTTTFPAATTTWVAAGSPAFSGYQVQLITNDSTNTVAFVPGTGMTFRCETQGPGTTTVISTSCSSTGVIINPTSTAVATGYWDNSSSSFIILWGNEWH